MTLGRRIVSASIAVLVVLGSLAGFGYWATHDWAAGRIWYKRMKAPSPYVYDEIPDFLLRTDPASLIANLTPQGIAPLKTRLNTVLWGTPDLPDRQPASVDTGKEPPVLREFDGVDRVERLVIPFELGYTAYAYLLHPESPNGRAVVYHHGYAGSVDQSRTVLEALLKQGYLVAAINYPGYGQNSIGKIKHPRFGVVSAENDRQMYYVTHPLRWYLEPMVVTINYLQNGGFSDISSVGFSAGGWVTTVIGAVDDRVKSTVAVASGYPLYIRAVNWDAETPLPQLYKPLLDSVSYLDIYVLASQGEGRQFIQIFNQFDRCCYRNRFSELYAPAVADAVTRLGEGDFTALIDVSHAEHMVSPWAVSEILSAFAE